MKKNQTGFTLIELLVVIAIIGLLSTLAVVAMNGARQKSRDAKRVADIKQIQTALEMYYNDKAAYPTLATTSVGLIGGATYCLGDSGFTTGACNTAALTKYMSNIPVPPATETNCTANPSYSYGSSDGSYYGLTFCLGADTGGIKSGLRTATQSGIQ